MDRDNLWIFRNEGLTGGKIEGDNVFKGDLSQKQYGVSIGGPIVKDRLFVFANFEVDEVTELGSGFIPNRGTGAINEASVLATDMDLVSGFCLKLILVEVTSTILVLLKV